MTLPERFKERMIKLLGCCEAQELFHSIESEDSVKAFRINRIKSDVDSFEKSGTQIDRQAVDFPPDAYITCEEFPSGYAAHHSGAIYIQDISAMSTVNAVKLFEGAKVLDACAAPGGKTTQLSGMVGESGVVVANEYDRKRSRILQSNVERMGAKNTIVCNLDTAVLTDVYAETFDMVLCDAPCSGEGMFRKNERAVSEWSEENVKMCVNRQREILENVSNCVKSGGRLLYSTCTFSLEENEENVWWFLEKHSDFKLIDVENELKAHTSDGICIDGCNIDMTRCRRIYPHRSCGEGQFIALFERSCNGSAATSSARNTEGGAHSKKNAVPRPSREELAAIAAARDFINENIACETVGELKLLGNLIYLVPDITLPPYNVVSAGTCVGEYQKGRILPHHQLFSAYGNAFKLQINLSGGSSESQKYLRGEEICVENALESTDGRISGWTSVMIDGCAVGGAKVSGGIAKNHYPKGLRVETHG